MSAFWLRLPLGYKTKRGAWFMRKRIWNALFIFLVMIFVTMAQSPVLAEPDSSIQVESRIVSGIYPNPYGLMAAEALMILTVTDQTSFDNFNQLTGDGRKAFLNQCLQNSWQEVAGSSKVYVRLDYQNKVYAYMISSHLADSAKLELESFDTGIDDLQFIVILNRLADPPPAIPEIVPARDRLFENIDYRKASAIRVIIDETPVKFDVDPQIIEGRTLVPMRAIFERFGLKVAWNETTRTALGYDDQHAISFTIGQNQAMVNEQAQFLDVPAAIIGGRTMIPLRFLSASLGYNVVWAGEADLILISRDNIIEWRPGGYETTAPYKEYEIKYSNGAKTNEIRYTGKTRPAVTITAQGIITQMRGTFYRVDFSDGFGVALTIPKHKVAYTSYEAAVIGVDGTKLTKAIDPGTIKITGFNEKYNRTFSPVNFTDYSAGIPDAIKNVYREQDFFLSAGDYHKDKEISGLVVFDSQGMLEGIEYNDGTHACKLYLQE